MAQDHFKTPPDPKKGYKNQKMTQKISKLVGVALGYFFDFRREGNSVADTAGTSRAVPCQDLVDPCRAKYPRRLRRGNAASLVVRCIVQ